MTVRIVVVGAGPTGLSIAAHLNARGLQPLVFGKTMGFWRDGMPRGMKLKSDGFASNLSEPSGRFTLKAFAAAHGLDYGDLATPIARDTFIAYGEAFQKRFVPQVDERWVKTVTREGEGFAVALDDGAIVEASDVIVAIGLAAFANIPKPLAGLTARRLTHSSRVADCARFAGQRVLVIGAGASATDCAAALVRAGAEVYLVCRDDEIRYPKGGGERTGLDKLRAPMTAVGPGWARWWVTTFPALFARLPDWLRVLTVDNMLGPAPAWFIRPEIEGRIRVLPSREILGAREYRDAVEVELGRVGAQIEYFRADHVVLGAGYTVDLRRLPLLSPKLLAEIDLVEGSPRLSRRFESSAPGLFFAGPAAAYAFGPAMRFVCGADLAARRIAAAVEARARLRREASAIAPSFATAGGP